MSNHFADFLPDKLEISDSVLHMGCDQKFALAKLIEIDGKKDELANAPAQIGTALHVGYQDFLVNGNEDKAVWEYMLRYPWDAVPSTSDKRSFEAGLSVLLKLCRDPRFINEPVAQIETKDGRIVPAIEVYFRVRIKNFYLGPDKTCPVYFRGLIDIVRHVIMQDQYAVEDLKTYTGYVNDPVAKYSFATQTTGYGFVFSQWLKQRDKIINGFNANYIVAKIDLLNPEISYHQFPKDQRAIYQWGMWLAYKLQHIKQNVKNGFFFRDSHSCFAFNKRCPFFDSCEDSYDYLAKMKTLANQDDVRYGSDDPLIEFELDLGFPGDD